MASTQPRIKGSNNQNIAIGTSQDGQMELHGDVGRGYCGWSPPKQSFFCCAFYSILCIVMAIVIIVTNSPTYDQEYNNPAEYYVANGTVIYVKEWQFLADYIKDADRMVPTVGIWCLAIGVPLFGSLFTLTYFGMKNDLYKTSEWIWDDIISLFKGYTIVFFLCYGMASFISARISLPKPSAYDICNYDLDQKQCQKRDDETLELAWSSFPNADISFLMGSMFYFALYFSNKMQMVLNRVFNKKFKASLEVLYASNDQDSNGNTSNDDNNKSNSSNTSNSNLKNIPDFGEHRRLSWYFIVVMLGFWPSYIALFVSITIVHDHIAYVWDLLGSWVIGVIMTWFTYGMFWDSPFDCMEVGFTFDLSGIPRNSFFYDKKVREIRKRFAIYNNVAALDNLNSNDNDNDNSNENENTNDKVNNGNVSGVGGSQAHTPVLVDNSTNTDV